MGRSQSQVWVHRRYKVIIINTFIIVPQGEVDESDSVRDYLGFWNQQYPRYGLLWSSIKILFGERFI